MIIIIFRFDTKGARSVVDGGEPILACRYLFIFLTIMK